MLLPVASTTTSSLASRVLPNPSNAVRVISMRPACRSLPSSQTTTSPKVRCTSMPITRRIRTSCQSDHMTGATGDTTTTDSRSQRNRASRRGGQLLTRARGSSYASACPHLRAPGASVPMVAPYATMLNIAAEHRHRENLIPVTNPIESTFATVRHRTIRSEGCLSNGTALAMVFKLVEGAQKSWRRLDGPNQLPKVLGGIKFTDGIEVVRSQAQAAA